MLGSELLGEFYKPKRKIRDQWAEMISIGESRWSFGTSRKYLNSLSIFRLRPRFFFWSFVSMLGKLSPRSTPIFANWWSGSDCSRVARTVACKTGGMGWQSLRHSRFPVVRFGEGGGLGTAIGNCALFVQTGMRGIFFLFIGADCWFG